MVIYYFTGTGNSLDVAKMVGKKFKNCDIKNIRKVIKNENTINDDVIGFVFPVYAYGPPLMVRDFISNIKLSKKNYVFAVSTCGGVPADTMGITSKLIRKSGGELSAGFVTVEKVHYYVGDNVGIIKFMKNIFHR